MRSALPAFAAVAAALALAGCGGSTGSGGQSTASVASTPTSPPTATASPATPTTTVPATTSATQPVTTSGEASARCRAADLSLSFLGGQAATGHGLLGFALRNASDHPCTMFGYPGIQFLSRGGQPLPTIPTHTTEDYFGTTTNHPFAIAPGETASFRLGVTHGAAASTANCATAWALQVIPPNDTSTLRVAISHGAYECQTATVSPMQRGTSAYP